MVEYIWHVGHGPIKSKSSSRTRITKAHRSHSQPLQHSQSEPASVASFASRTHRQQQPLSTQANSSLCIRLKLSQLSKSRRFLRYTLKSVNMRKRSCCHCACHVQQLLAEQRSLASNQAACVYSVLSYGSQRTPQNEVGAAQNVGSTPKCGGLRCKRRHTGRWAVASTLASTDTLPQLLS